MTSTNPPTCTDIETLQHAIFLAWHGMPADQAQRLQPLIHNVNRNLERAKLKTQTEIDTGADD